MAEKEKVVLAYSGGLDTSVIVKWLQEEKNLDVIAICGNVGQDEKDLSWIKQKALDMGAIASEAVDMREEYAEKILSKAIWANGKYEGVYPLLSALSRPLISKHLVDIAHQYGAKYVAHGCTGKGNDQVRFETCIRALDPELEIIAPVRVWDLTTRDSEMEWAKQHGVPVPTTHKKPYSIDDNLWGRAIECGVLEDTWNKPPADIWTMTKNLDECPAALLLIQAHQSLEQLCLDAETLKQKAKLDVEWASTVYRGLWFSQNRNAIDAFNAYTQKYVTGDVRIILCKGGLFVDGLRSDYSLYDYNLATYDEGDTFDHTAARGFIDLHGLQSKTWSRVQGPGSGLQPVE